MDEEKQEQFALVPLSGVKKVVGYLASKPLPYAETAPLIHVLETAKVVTQNPPTPERPKNETANKVDPV